MYIYCRSHESVQAAKTAYSVTNMSANPLIPIEKLKARAAAGASLTLAAGYASASLDKLAIWFLTGFGVGIALTLSHLKDVSDFIPTHCIASAAYLFLFASILCLAQRYVAMIVGCGASGAKEGGEIGEKFKDMDVQEFIAQMKMGIPRLFRPLLNGPLNDVAKGDLAVMGRLFIRLTMLQGILATIEVALLLIALSRIVNEI